MRATALAATALALPTPRSAEPAAKDSLIDVNANLHRWPFRRLPGDDPAALIEKLHSRGVTQAWVGSLDALLHKDLAAVNARLADDCRQRGRQVLLPFGNVNPAQPDWEEEFRRCAEIHGMRGLRLYPNYHGYKLDHPGLQRLLRVAADRHLIVQIALVMEDERMMHPLLRVEPVDTAPLLTSLRDVPSLRVILLNALRTLRGPTLQALVAAGAHVDIAMLEGVGGVGQLLQQVSTDRVLFGSHAPLFYYDSAELKLRESTLTPVQMKKLRGGNARRILA